MSKKHPNGWRRKIKGTAWIYTHPNAYDSRGIVVNIHGIWFNGVEYGDLTTAKLAALGLSA